jgi:hypothetical protein
MPDTIPAPEKPMTRLQAQRKLGLFAPFDITIFVFVVLLTLASLVTFVGAAFGVEVNYPKATLILCADILLCLAWLIVLVYRAMVFILDLHSDVALMPEAAGRIAAGYFEGRLPGAAPKRTK